MNLGGEHGIELHLEHLLVELHSLPGHLPSHLRHAHPRTHQLHLGGSQPPVADGACSGVAMRHLHLMPGLPAASAAAHPRRHRRGQQGGRGGGQGGVVGGVLPPVEEVAPPEADQAALLVAFVGLRHRGHRRRPAAAPRRERPLRVAGAEQAEGARAREQRRAGLGRPRGGRVAALRP
jgi:hypothetical protein